MIYHEMNDLNPYIIFCAAIDKHNLPPDIKFPKRLTRWYEVELIPWGEGYLITDGKKMPATRGSLFFRNPGTVVQGFLPYHYYTIIFDAVYCSAASNMYMDRNPFGMILPESGADNLDADYTPSIQFNFPQMIRVSQFEKFQELFSSLHREYIYKKINSPLHLKSLLLQILVLIYDELKSAQTVDHSNRSLRANYPKIMQVKHYIDCNTNKNFHLDGLAELVGLSPSFFGKIFKSIIGETPINYINRSKINMAKRLLIETGKGIKEIAYECGFDNDTYFYTLFKKHEGFSPAVFRERHQYQHTGGLMLSDSPFQITTA